MKMTKWISVCLLILSSLHSLAAGTARSGFLGVAGLNAGVGSSGDKNDAIKKREMAYSELYLNLGYQFGMIAPLVQASYRYVGQTKDPADVSDTNLGGTGVLMGAGLLADFSSVKLTAVYVLSGSFALAKETSGGGKMTYTKPKGFHVDLGIPWKTDWDFVINFSSVDYEKSKSDSTETDLASNPVNQTLYGLGLAYRF
jgi:hypothetical protein